ELFFVYQLRGVAVDEPFNSALQSFHSAIKLRDLIGRSSVVRSRQAPAILVCDTARMLQHDSHLFPYCLLKSLTIDCLVVVSRPAEAMRVGPQAAIVVALALRSVTRRARGRTAIAG